MTEKRPTRIAVFLKAQNPSFDLAGHSASKSLALLVLSNYSARWTSEGRVAIHLMTGETWKQVKLRIRGCIGPKRKQRIPLLNPPGPDGCLLLSYPPLPQESDGLRRQRQLWMRAERF